MGTTTQKLALGRINSLLDDSSFVEIGALVKARSTDFNMTDIVLLQDTAPLMEVSCMYTARIHRFSEDQSAKCMLRK